MERTGFKFWINIWAALLSVTFVACEKDDEDDKNNYTVPATYSFKNSAGESTVSFSGQMQRLDMLSEMVTYMKTANTLGNTVDAATLKAMYANDNYNWTDANGLDLIGSSKQLKSKTALGDVGVQAVFEGYMDDMAAASALNFDNSAETYGNAGVWTNGTKTYLQSATGVEYTQLIEKGLMCAVFMNQMTNNYLNNVLDDDNEEIEEGKTYTEMQHHWDEAYGYLTSEIDFPAHGTDRFWGKYVSGREQTLGSATKLSEAFRKGRAAIDNKDYDTRNAQITIIKDEMEKVCAGTAIHYLNSAKENITDPTVLNHAMSEAWAFLNGLRYGDNAVSGVGMTTTEIDTALGYIGTDFELITISKLNAAIDLIAEKTELTDVKDGL